MSEDQIIRRILEDEKFKQSKSREEMSYRDEPIIMRASQMANFTPRKYREMREIAKESQNLHKSSVEIFYLQGKFMEDFSDSYMGAEECLCYYPTYQSLNTPQLRTYFTFRSRVREGEFPESSLSYIYLYIYELLNQIGVKTKEEGLIKLKELYQAYGKSNKSIEKNLREWIRDYGIYYDLPKESIAEFSEEEFDESFDKLAHYETSSNEELFSAVSRLSSYNIEKSKIYKSNPSETMDFLSDLYREVAGFYDKNGKKSYLEKLYGLEYSIAYYPMYTAVFFQREKRAYYEYRLSSVTSYRCVDGHWTQKRSYLKARKSTELGELLKNGDAALRELLSVRPMITVNPLPAQLEKILEKLVKKFREDQKKAREIQFDFSILSKIREDAGETREKLLTEEERGEELSGMKDSEVEAESAGQKAKKQNPLGLSEDAVQYLNLLLDEGRAAAENYVKSRKLMLSILVDQINEAFCEELGDIVLDMDGEGAELIEDYIEDVRGMIEK